MENSPAASPLFSPLQVGVASMIGGPVPACWLLARNFQQLGRPRSAKHCLIWGAAGMVALLFLGYYLPENFPRAAIPIGYTIGLYQTASQLQGAAVRAQLAAGGAPAPWMVVIRASLLALLALLGVLMLASLLLAPRQP